MATMQDYYLKHRSPEALVDFYSRIDEHGNFDDGRRLEQALYRNEQFKDRLKEKFGIQDKNSVFDTINAIKST